MMEEEKKEEEENNVAEHLRVGKCLVSQSGCLLLESAKFDPHWVPYILVALWQTKLNLVNNNNSNTAVLFLLACKIEFKISQENS